MKVFISCGGYYANFEYPKPLVKINGETLIDRTLRLLSKYETEPFICCNPEEMAFNIYDNVLRVNYTFNYLEQTGYYLDLFDAVPCDEPCIYLFGDVYYSEDAIKRIMEKFSSTDRNIFICNQFAFNSSHNRVGEPFGWIVKDPEEFHWAVKLGKRFQDRGLIDHANGIPSNWELAHLINGLNINTFNLRKEDCLIIEDETIDVDAPSEIENVEKRVAH